MWRRAFRWGASRAAVTMGVARRVLAAGLVAGPLLLALRGAWLGDDAYITFRTADNLLHGLGPVWNADERVQTFTNPLWMLIFSAAHALTREAFYTTIALQIAITAAALWILVTRVASSAAGAAAAALGLCLSKAFVDFSTSGLENPLNHLLLAGFLALYFRLSARGPATPPDDRALGRLTTLGALLLLSRMDNLWLVLPPLAVTAAPALRDDRTGRIRRETLFALAIGAAPFLAWEVFSLVYYGFPFPNTAYAKLAGGIPAVLMVRAGLFYLQNSLRVDPVTLSLIALAVPWAILAGERGGARPVALGILLHVAYTVRAGGDFMSGRFLTAPLFAAVCLLAATPREVAIAPHLVAAAVALLAARAGRFAALTSPLDAVGSGSDANGIADAARESIGLRLLDGTRFTALPSHGWADEGRAMRDQPPAEVPVRGGVGLLGFYAGPAVHILDPYALTDPLLARLPVPDAKHEMAFRTGHLGRAIPEGYRETLTRGKNVIRDRDLAAYYDDLSLVTRGRTFSAARLVAVLRLNLGLDDHLLASQRAAGDVKKVTLAELNRGGDKDRWNDYTSTQLGLRDGALFTEAGLLVDLGRASSARALSVQLSAGSFTVVPMRGRVRRPPVRVAVPSGPGIAQPVTIDIPEETARQGYDHLLFVPESPPRRGFAAIKKLVLQG